MGTEVFCRQIADQMTCFAKFAGFRAWIAIVLLSWLPAPAQKHAQTETSAPQAQKKQVKAQHRVLGRIMDPENLPVSKIKVTIQSDALKQKLTPPVTRPNKGGDLWYGADLIQPGNYTITVAVEGCKPQVFPDELSTTGQKWEFKTITLPPCATQTEAGESGTTQLQAAHSSAIQDPVTPEGHVLGSPAPVASPAVISPNPSASPAVISPNKEVAPQFPQDRTARSRSFSLVIAAVPGRRVEELLWIAVLLAALCTLLFQALAFFNQPRAAPDLSREIDILRSDVVALESHMRSARAQWERGATDAGPKSETIVAARAAAPAMEMTASVPPARHVPIILEQAREPGSAGQDFPGPALQPVFGQDIVADYERTRSAPDQEKAILQFESAYPYLRLSLVNQKEVEINPSVAPEFESSSRGYFLGVERNRQMLCFPWFSLDFSQPAFHLAFDYKSTGRPLLRVPARLAARAGSWTLQARGQIESGS